MKSTAHIVLWILLFVLETLIYWGGRYWGISSINEAIYYNSIIYIPKIIGVYLFLYYLAPGWRSHDSKGIVNALLSIAFILLWLIVYRYVINRIAWPIVFQKTPEFSLIDISLSLFSLSKLLSPLILLLLVDSIDRTWKQRKKNEALRQEKLATELRYLRSQLNPHFLFNTLNNIYVLAHKKSEKTAPAIAKLSNMLRFMLYETEDGQINIQQEIDLIRQFIELEQLRYGDRLTCSFQMDDQPLPLRKIPAGILLSLVENAYKHGASQSTEVYEIFIRLNCTTTQLSFSIQNPYQSDQLKHTDGIGLKNLRRILELNYPGAHQLDINTENDMYALLLQINFHASV